MAETVTIRLNVNGRTQEVRTAPHRMLLDVLRDELALIGTKECCREGECGSCTVVVDGEAVNSCLMFAVSAQGKAITTVEGLKEGGQLHPLQQAFLETGGVQCGFCTPGILMTLATLLASTPAPTEREVRLALSGNICRCTGYNAVVEAALKAAAVKV